MDDFTNQITQARKLNQFIFESMSPETKFEKLAEIMERKNRNKLARDLRFNGSNFDTIVFELICKAQMTPDNTYRLRMGFPEYVELWEEWQAAENEEDFFNKYKLLEKVK